MLNRLDDLKRIHTNKEKGIDNFISYNHSLPKLSNHISGIIKGRLGCITASSGVAKTKFTKFLTIIVPFLEIKRQRELNLPEKRIKTFYFCFEESRADFIDSLFCSYLGYKYGFNFSTIELQGKTKHIIDIDKITKDFYKEHDKEEFNELLSTVEIIEDVTNPTGIYNILKKHVHENGQIYFYNPKNDPKGHNKITLQDYENMIDAYKRDYSFFEYVEYDENLYTQVVIDHISLITEERENGIMLNHYDAMSKLVTVYIKRQLCDKFRFCAWIVQQQSMDSDNKQFGNNANLNLEKLKPSKSELGDNKIIGRDYSLIIGLFRPGLYINDKYMGYNLAATDLSYKDYLVSVLILKNRDGKTGVEIPTFCKGATNEFFELSGFYDKENSKKFDDLIIKLKEVNKDYIKWD